MNGSGKILVVTCSGASNTGSLADCVVRELVAESPERFEMLCLPAYALGRENALRKVREARKVLAVDGCPTRCASTLLEKGGRVPDLTVEVSEDYDMKKTMDPRCNDQDMQRVKEDIKKRIAGW